MYSTEILSAHFRILIDGTSKGNEPKPPSSQGTGEETEQEDDGGGSGGSSLFVGDANGDSGKGGKSDGSDGGNKKARCGRGRRKKKVEDDDEEEVDEVEEEDDTAMKGVVKEETYMVPDPMPVVTKWEEEGLDLESNGEDGEEDDEFWQAVWTADAIVAEQAALQTGPPLQSYV